MPELVTTRSDDGVLVVTLNNPARRNVLDPDLTAALLAALEASSGVAAVALLAAGDHFCVGGDVSAFGAAVNAGEYVRALAVAFQKSCGRWAQRRRSSSGIAAGRPAPG